MAKDIRTQSELYATIGTGLIEREPSLAAVRASEATIVYLSSPVAKVSHGRATLGTCERVPDRWRWAVPADFAITVYEPNVRGMSESQLKTLIFHELLHVGIGHDKDGYEVYKVLPHDVEDFREVLERWGLDWSAHEPL